MDLVPTALLHGAALCAGMTGIIVGSLRQDPMIWARSSPPDVQAFVGPPSPATSRRKRAWSVVMLIVLVAVFGSLARGILSAGGSTWDVAVAAWISFQVFNLYDAVVIDLGLVIFKPRWAMVPGAADLPGLRDPRWHLGNYLKGLVGGFVFAGLVAGSAWLFG